MVIDFIDHILQTFKPIQINQKYQMQIISHRINTIKDLKNSYIRHQLPLLFRLDTQKFVESQFKGLSNNNIGQNLDSTG